MPETPSAEDILRDVEFELVQSALGSDELASGMTALRRLQNTSRASAMKRLRPDGRTQEAVSDLYQINDVMLTVLEGTAESQRALRHDLRRALSLPDFAGGKHDSPAAKAAGAVKAAGLAVRESRSGLSPQELEEAVDPRSLDLSLQVRSGEMPIVGGLIHRLRVFLHVRGIVYARELAGKQARVNRLMGDWLLHLMEENEANRQEIAALRAQVAALQEIGQPDLAGTDARGQ